MINLNSQKNNLQKRGFTLVETLVAVSILMVSVVGPLVFASQGVTAAIYARDQITAFYLAQDAVEQIRNIRDNNSIKSRKGEEVDWLSGLEICKTSYCTMSTINTVTACPANVCPSLSYNPTTFIYGYDISGGIKSNYTRKIKITEDPLTAGVEAKVEVTISWNTGSLQRSFTVHENIFNWAQ